MITIMTHLYNNNNIKYYKDISLMYVYFYFQPLMTVGNFFIVNLALADFCVTGFINPFSIVGKIFRL